MCAAWNRFKDLMRRCPHYPMTNGDQVRIFFNGCKPAIRMVLNGAAGGSIKSMRANETLALIERMAANENEGLPSKSKRGILHLDNNDAVLAENKLLSQQMANLTSRLDKMQLSSVQAQAASVVCEYCKGDHESNDCSSILSSDSPQQVQANGVWYDQRSPPRNSPRNQNFPSGNTNFQRRGQGGGLDYSSNNYLQPPPIPAKEPSNLEKLVGQMAQHSNAFMEETRANIPRTHRAIQLNLEDRPDILCRVFKFKLDQLLHDLKKENILGRVIAYVCTIEFQKRGLPHAHILLFLNPSSKAESALDIDKLILAEIPDKETNPTLFMVVTSYMIHGPCGPENYKSPCMKDGRCSKKFPKNFYSRTLIDDDGFPHYKRRNDGRVVNKNGVELDNRYVVPYNAHLLLKYQAHINVEYTCQRSAIKYLFKYIHKGNDRVTAAINHSDDEIKMFYDCRYVSACEAAWRIFGFDIHSRYPSVQRLPFHLPNEKNIIFSDNDSLYDVKTRAESRLSIFESWMDGNKKYPGGLLDDNNEYIDAIKEASSWGFAAYLRCLFALLLFANSMNRPEKVWEKCWKFLSDDVVYRHRKRIGRQDAILTEESIKNITLEEIDKVLQSNGKCLSDYPSMPRINSETLLDMQNRLVLDELMYDRFALEEEHKRLINSLTDEQKAVYDKIVSAVTAGNGGLFFLYGFGGTGKTFIWNTLSASIRSKVGIVLNVASSGIASLLLPGGRTAHSRFRIPIQINEDSTCNIRPKSTIAELLSKTKLIIWEEAPMVHRFCFEALDRTLRDVLRISDSSCVDMPFGGKVVILGGDFQQILPVIPHGSRQDIVHATINSSHLWSHCHLLTLTKNMRLNSGSSAHNLEEIKEFSEWLLKVGDGNLGDDVDGESIITIPDELLIRESEDPLSDMVNFVYPNLLDNILDQTFFKERVILTPKLSDVAMLNEHLMSMIPVEERTFLSSDKILKQGGTSSVEDDEITPEILNTLSCSGIPDNKLILKVKVPVMLLRNIDQSRGLCNDTRLLITKLGNHVVEAIVLTGSNIRKIAMTINKSQGQSLSHVAIYLPKPIFTHG
ncbi:uncharacterized protein LOC133316000, partial [Gastrolobium bilobum]|uniref:uncharacterized protein LOC133316000 n=1 Tax=Gastrolobium bilobum TaxID=150636 RepID=UPI002AB1050B